MAAGAAPKKAALLIALGGLKKKPPGEMGDTEPDGDEPLEGEAPPAMGDVKSMATSDVMAAFKTGDRVALEDALTRFVEACTSEGYGK